MSEWLWRELLSRFAEFAFFHSLTDEPVDESALAIHHVEFPVETVPRFCNGSGVGEHRNRSIRVCLIPRIRNNSLQISYFKPLLLPFGS